MTFKNYLKNLNEDTSSAILKYIKFKSIPLSPKFFEEVFNQGKEKYCFVSIKPNRIQSLIRRQNKKNQISAFTNYKDTSIFFGADGLEWSEHGETIVAVLKGKVTLEGNNDLWTQTDQQGRRWIDTGDVRDNNNGSDEVANLLNIIQRKIYTEFREIFASLINPDEMSNEYTRDYIKTFFDVVYKVLTKYKTRLKKAINPDETKKYNEVLCYDYTIKEFIVLVPEHIETMVFKGDRKSMEKIGVLDVTKEEQISKRLKKYQKLKA